MPYKDPVKRNENMRAYRKANPERMRAIYERKRALRRAWVDERKSSPCVDCGGRFAPIVMDFHHRDAQDKIFSIAKRFVTASLAALEAEIAKCDLLCANCHRLRTWPRPPVTVAP